MISLDSSENEFLTKLTEVVEANLTNPQFGVSMLAKEIGMSRSNLHRKVNELTKITVSQFINQVRLKKAKEILRHSSDTISEIAYKVGFSNVSYFIKCFNRYYGYSPGEVGKREKDERNSLPLHTNKKWLIRIIVAALFLVILAVALILVFKPFSLNQKQQTISIAVLPFIDDSPEEGNEYIINGVRREILGKLGKIKDLRVIPGSSAEKYSNSNLSIREIAKELNADYILCGNGQKIGTSIKIILELIETKTGYNLWTKPYIKEVNDNNIFELQEEMSLAVAGELEVNITSDEKERIAKIPTDNKIAWDFYLRGIEKKTDSLEVAITLFEKALDLDNEFAIAYAQLAYTYYALDRTLEDKIHLTLIEENADKALMYDPELDMSWIAKALYYYIKRDNELAIQLFEKALQCNPNSELAIINLAFIHNYYSFDFEKSLEYNLLANKLNIVAGNKFEQSFLNYRLSQALRSSGFLKEAEEYIKKSLELNPENVDALVEKSQLISEMTGRYEQAKKILEDLFEKHSSQTWILRHLALTCYMDRDYENAYKYYKIFTEILETQHLRIQPSDYGRIGFVFHKMGMKQKSEEYFKKFENLNSAQFYLLFAGYYSFRKDTVKAFEHLKLNLKKENFPIYNIRILKQDPLFDNIRELPEFQQLLSEIEAKFWKNNERIRKNLKKKGLL